MADDSQESRFNGKRVALGVSGGIAAYKAAEILRGLQRAGCIVRVAMTARACEFITPLTFRALSGSHVIVDDYAPDNPDPIAHITFSQSVDLLLVAPATANIIAKFANGVADDFLTSTYLASNAPVLIAPAMNTTMWNHPATQRNLQQLRADGVCVIEPDAGEMACGTFGPGRLSEPERIVAAALELLRESERHPTRDMMGERVLITAGATREEIDPVRFLSNRSSGRMGFALAEAAHARGAEVTVVAGATSAEPPANVNLVRALSAEEMRAAVMKETTGATIFIAAAAVSDYRPSERAANKIKKAGERITLTLEPTPDILAEVAQAKQNGLLVVGFAAETNDVLKHARTKLEAKRLDAIVANDVTRDGAGFDTETNIITIITRAGDAPVELPLMSKLDASHRILDEIAHLRRTRNGK
ncbi:MAG: phosphopantothenoylcysteine decarboxylase / phosphopantothenate---cysteine ligase [Acidobacteriota bacterium]|jgi:phosphopantothenoylcysteine decarboxylase/phosphopantothenate--cysteine ligase|nr:phosphopantothenoylcysteine decarboxylase / phosphopantothenate---cysteine ligase [Acidobacteriota bacterium]